MNVMFRPNTSRPIFFQKKTFLLMACMVFFGTLLFAQSKTDSLLNLLRTETHEIDFTSQIDLLNKIGLSLEYNYPDSSLKYYTLALDISTQNNLEKEKGITLNRIGGYQYIKGDYYQCIETFTEALKISKAVNDPKGIAIGLNNLGITSTMLDKFEAALDYHQQSAQICIKNHDSLLLSLNYFNMGITFEQQEQFDSAMVYAEKAIQLYALIGQQKRIIHVLNLKGMILLGRKQYRDAYKIFKEVNGQSSQQNNWENCYALSGMALSELGMENYQESIKFGLKSLALAQQLDTKWDILEVSKILYKGYAALKIWDSAFEYLLMHNTYSDSLISWVKDNELHYLEIKKAEAENKFLANENKIKQQDISRKNNLIVAFIFVLLLLLVIALILWRSNKTQKRLNKELQVKNKLIATKNEELTSLNTTKDTLFRIIGHDLKSPFGLMVSFTDDMLASFEDYNQKTLIDISKSLNRTSLEGIRLLDNLLDWTRTQTGTIANKPELTNIKQLVEENFLLLIENAEKKNIQMKMDIAENLSAFIDPNMTSTVLRNLISNAIKFTPSGGHILIKACQQNDQVKFIIEDSGLGIDKIDLEKLFDLKTHISTPGTNKEIGSGLGLMICKDFIEKQGGRITIESEVGKGSRIAFFLPIK
jgi:signal transduction histidine kinase